MTTTTAGTGIDALFGHPVEPDKLAPMLEREHLQEAVIVRHRGSRKVTTANGTSTIQTFSLIDPEAPGADALWFSTWGSAHLNSQLGKVRANSTMLLRYTGQVNNTDGTPGAHQWDVKVSTTPLPAIMAYLQRDDQAQRLIRLRDAIARATILDRDRRDARRGQAPAGPPHDDDDLPF